MNSVMGLLALAALSFQAAPHPDAQSGTQSASSAAVVKEARALIDGGRPKEAIARLEPLMPQAGSGDPQIVELLGVAYYHADDYTRAVQTLERVRGELAEGSLERAEAEQVLGLSLHLLGRYAEAVPWLERTRQRMKQDLELSQVLGVAYIQTGQADKARPLVAEVFGVPPDAAAAYVATAQLMIRLEQNELAQAELARAMAKDPTLPRAHALAGQLALFRGRLEEAIELTKKELAINPTDAMAFSQLGDAYVRLQRWDDAIEALQRSIWINPFYSAPHILLARAYLQKQQPATAEGFLRRAIEYDPNNRTAHYLLAQTLQRLGRTEEAKREFEVAEKLQEAGRR
jgi:tetratricopeptide (TPR) repeat protein